MNVDCNEQRAAAAGQGIMRAFAGCEEILKNNRSLSGQTSEFGSLKSSSEAPTSPLVLLDIADDDPDDSSIVQVPHIVICLPFHIFFCTFFLSTNISFLLRQNRFFVTTFPILALRLSQNVTRIASSIFTSQASKPHATLTPMYQRT